MFIQRRIWPELIAHLEEPEITLLIGPRQSGKTTLLKKLQEYILKNSLAPVIFLNLDVIDDERLFTSQSGFLRRMGLEVGGSKHAIIIIDEIQRLTNAGRFLKGLYDLKTQYKFVVSGSGSLELKESIGESLVGRKHVIELLTVGLTEFLDYSTQYKYSDNLIEWASIEKDQANSLFNEYINFGGYPKVVTSETKELKNRHLREILEGYLLKDIRDLLNLNRSDAYRLMLRLLATNIGQISNISTLANDSTIAVPTLKKYLWYAEKTYIVERVPPYFSNPKKELTKAPHYYYIDLGFRNLLLNTTGDIVGSVHEGPVFQNAIWRMLRQKFKSYLQPIHHWRTKDKAEVDFVINTGNRLLPIEIKSGSLIRPKIGRSFRSFCTKYNPEQAWIINRSLSHEMKIGSTHVFFKPWYQLIS